MLILSRRSGESIVVDEKVTLTVLSIKGRQVRIGIDAPDDVSVHRQEIFQKIKEGESTGFEVVKGARSALGNDSPVEPTDQSATKDVSGNSAGKNSTEI